MSKYFLCIFLFFLIFYDYQITRNFQEVKLDCNCTEQQVLELIKMYEEYGFIYSKTQRVYDSVRYYKIHFIKKIEENNILTKKEKKIIDKIIKFLFCVFLIFLVVLLILSISEHKK